MARYEYTHFIPENIAPKNTREISVYDANGEKVGSIPLGILRQPLKEKLYSFCAVSDVHIAYDTANEDFQRSLTFVENSDCVFTCVCGDLTADGSETQLADYKSVIDTYALTKPVYAIAGNHEALTEPNTDERIQPYTGQPLYYSFEQENDVFIMLGEYRANNVSIFAESELQWLYETLESNRNKRCFVFFHIFPWGDCGNACGIYSSDLFSGTQGNVFLSLLKHYKNTVLFHGHSHLRFDLQEIDEKANYSKSFGYRSVHIPSLSVPRDGDTTGANSRVEVYAESEGYIVDVYDDYIILNGRDFIDNDKDGHILPIATYKIDTTLVNVEANTFTDSTGTITT